MKRFTIALVVLSLVSSSAFAQPILVRFNATPNEGIQAEEVKVPGGEPRLEFSFCELENAADGINVGACESIGRADGYRTSVLNEQYEKMRNRRYINNGVALTVGTGCGTFLGMLGGALIFVPMVSAGSVGFFGGLFGMFLGSEHGAENFVTGMMSIVGGYLAMLATSTIGTVLGPFAYWKVTKRFLHPFKQSQKSLAPFVGAKGQQEGAVVIDMKGSAVEFRKGLEKAFEPINLDPL